MTEIDDPTSRRRSPRPTGRIVPAMSGITGRPVARRQAPTANPADAATATIATTHRPITRLGHR